VRGGVMGGVMEGVTEGVMGVSIMGAPRVTGEGGRVILLIPTYFVNFTLIRR
jgi:hypothetical protein